MTHATDTYFPRPLKVLHMFYQILLKICSPPTGSLPKILKLPVPLPGVHIYDREVTSSSRCPQAMQSRWRPQCGQVPGEELNKPNSKHSLEPHHTAKLRITGLRAENGCGEVLQVSTESVGAPEKARFPAPGLWQSRGWE